ncbi:tRNA uridine-5-carboxymethylaminomethyl(34) synthesis GTPase MnmE [Blochmannia endosymbiont of Polyrhachis (Hedomyrma) turneri]|uniref:tRNA uridine-5-carboxymethylaminomethyl(34) synthesis GTPase MnmE n=1 Tax=Blochmannia endosymbiont of Polyrhachis (Hedomyrma) turneri TaxID=1505596 RepID=UPI00061A860E|nr:tRNA uridine-5-carboxymethylaminomethyl(34) synthesis GTPase MnmE [Blochmannia endosymbiont of Polyrhachis (Hedomyrma) turneri]AKC59607.1 tRNA modification GTPase MnmE [Blochmannia endosymbiont of Polyrhachis (Hedomyrma) turneri]
MTTNHHYYLDTIVALATPLGQSSIGVIRISGTLVPKISHKLLKILPYPRQATHLPLYAHKHKNILDNVIALFFPKPNSFTGEDILEIHGHGGPIILNTIIQNILNISPEYIRIARPGEFSERAFINNKIDLIQAEAIADLINATSYRSAQLASNTLQGKFSKKIHTLEQQLSNLRMYIESNIDFPDEQIKIIDYTNIKNQTNNIINKIKKIYQNAQNNILIQQGIKVVITGKPNSGKSSLFNTLSEKEAAIVTPIAGTTRDILHEHIQLNNGILIQIIDTAGLQETNNLKQQNTQKHITENEIEKIGIKRAWNEIKQANHILLLIDSNNPSSYQEHLQLQLKIKQQLIDDKTPITIIRNKADLTNEKINITHTNQQTTITISAKYNKGIDLIKKHLENNITPFTNDQEKHFISHQRHIEALKSSYQHLLKAKKIIKNYSNNTQQEYDEILAEELRYAYIELKKITGKYNSNELLKKIFSTFCIGK